MATDTPRAAVSGTATPDPDANDSASRIAGLDALELQPTKTERNLGRSALGAWNSIWPKLLAIAIVLLAWQLVVLSEWKPEYVFPGPADVIEALRAEIATGTFWHAILITMRRALTGFFFAVVIGTVVGAAVAAFKPLRAAIGSLITGLQTMPSVVWFPFAVLLFQISESAIMFVVILGAAPSVANGLISGIDYVPPLWKRVGTVLGMRGFALYRHLILPASLPSFVAGLKQGWSFAWRSLMAGELLVIVAGELSLGALLQGARDLSDAPLLLSYVIVVLIIGVVVDIAFNAADNAIRRRRGLIQP